MTLTVVRSLLFAPGSDERKLRKSLESGADAVIWDLEDSVAHQEKRTARALVLRLLGEQSAAPCLRLVRVNARGTELGEDLEALEGAPVDLLVLPKATPASFEELGSLGLPVVALLETAIGISGAEVIAALPQVQALMLGALDLSAELGLSALAGGEQLLAFRSQIVLASAVAGIRAPIDSPYPRLDDPGGLAAECRLVRALGFRAKACIHPAQVVIVNRELAPTEAEIEWAKAVLEEFDAAGGAGVARVAGQMVDAPVVERARDMLAEAERSGA